MPEKHLPAKDLPKKMLGEIPRPTGRFADHQARAIVPGKSPTEHDKFKLRETKFREET
jgi:hypothetical protein